MALTLYNVLQKFLTYTLYHWATKGTERSTISTASSISHKYRMIQHLCQPVTVAIETLLHLKKLTDLVEGLKLSSLLLSVFFN